MRLWRQTWLLTRSDLRQELRDRGFVLVAGLFSLLLVAMFAISFTALPAGNNHRVVLPGLLWMSVAFVGVLTLTRIFDREREADTLRALLAAPVDRLAIYLSKAAVTLIILLTSCALLVPGLALLFPELRMIVEQPAAAGLMLVLGSLGFTAVGAVFAAGLATGSGKNVLISVILYPLTTPVLMFDIVATRALLERHPDVWGYVGRLAALDAILLAVGALLFESIVVGVGRTAERRAS